MTIKLDLSRQEYHVFNVNPESSTMDFKNKNFIFGKNGAGKSTVCGMIVAQFVNDYDVHVFAGFDNVLEDKKLNAVVLGEENISAKKEIDSIDIKLMELISKRKKFESELKSLEWNESYIEEGIEKSSLYTSREHAKTMYETQENEVEWFFRAKAKELKEYKNPQVTKTSYSKNNFSNDIRISKVLDEVKKEEYEGILSDKSKSLIAQRQKVINIDFAKLIDEVNQILDYKVEQVSFIEEIKDDSDRKEFAKRGLGLHRSGENCSFCGNEVKEERITELKSFISVSAIQESEKRINKKIEEVKKISEQVEGIKELDRGIFYSSFNSDIANVNKEIRIKKKEYEYILSKLKDSLEEKAKSLFHTFEKLKLKIPGGFLSIEKDINELVEKNNTWTNNIDKNQDSARKKLRLHYVGLKIKETSNYKSKWRGYEIENHELSNLKKSLEQCRKAILEEKKKLKGSNENMQENTMFYLDEEINKLVSQKEVILKQTKNTYRLVNIINTKLKRSGKTNLELILVKDEDSVEHYQLKDGNSIRSIDKLSTGEKNIIGFLYFLECLSDPEKRSDKNKIIVFDDPMNSNDDTMQYLIITEMQKLYTNKYPSKFNAAKDYFLCLTHNAHFYLNVQPQGNFKEQKKVGEKIVELSKYDKHGFYRLEGGKIKHITSQKDDFNTHYEFLWIELKSLYINDLLNSMLNSMRRIIETYTKFNKINPVIFYKDKEEHQKLFNVNSHSIDDHSMEVIGKDKDEIVRLFKALFDSNNASEHFATHWKVK
ncbi:hypothetical protein AC739_19050 [Planococcus glaciei]|uniref:AAA family ATPase n=1 Tax=Planococcus glaciei TaxID=459472 RepID=UPI00069F8845|nr:AAA family ATPase [Planococcus glaciei]KOF08661.1 hypothetical protein AC739_19050 [Planococcus glaciei]